MADLQTKKANDASITALPGNAVNPKLLAFDEATGELFHYLLSALAKAVDLVAAISRIAALEAVVTNTTPDSNNFITNVQELLTAFSTYPEGLNLLTALNS